MSIFIPLKNWWFKYSSQVNLFSGFFSNNFLIKSSKSLLPVLNNELLSKFLILFIKAVSVTPEKGERPNLNL